jgi:hypothetical protein
MGRLREYEEEARWAPYRTSLSGRWSPAMKGLESAADRQEMGLAILSALSISGLHAAICPSWFTMASFASQPEAQERAMKGLWISLGASTLASAGLYFVFNKWLPAIVGEATALALFGIGVWAIHSKPPETIPPIEQQSGALPQPVRQVPLTTQA